MTAVLGISCHYHDAAAALVVDGDVVAAAQEERFSRIKHDPSFPVHAIRHCLRAGGLAGADLDRVVFYERPLRKLGRVLVSGLAGAPASGPVLRRSLRRWWQDKLWVQAAIARQVGVPPSRISFVEHHLAHAASALFAAPFTDAATLTVDGVGEWSTATIGWGTGDFDGGTSQLHLTSGLDFPHSLGLLYSAFTDYLGFEVNEGEFKVMGMAAYGRPRYRDELDRICRIHHDGSLSLDLRYFAFHTDDTRTFTDRLVRLLGAPPRTGGPVDLDSAQGRHYADVAASVQALCEDAVVAMASYAHRCHPSPNLAYAGGVALNGLANRAILERTPFERLYIPPAPGDAGGALGAALYAYHVLLGQPRRYVGQHADLGASYQYEVAETLRDWGVDSVRHDTDDLCAVTADAIAAGQVIGWHQGRFEWGPRALGHRSILADPGHPEMKERINRKVKFREQFRPFAPAVLAEEAGRYFAGPVEQDPVRFMLMVLPVRDAARDQLPATTHFGTARAQTVHRDHAGQLAGLLDHVQARTGHAVLLNTSFNLRGEPIVASPADALATFFRSDLDLLVMGSHVISKR